MIQLESFKHFRRQQQQQLPDCLTEWSDGVRPAKFDLPGGIPIDGTRFEVAKDCSYWHSCTIGDPAR